MIYQNYQLLANAGDQVRGFAELAQSILEHWFSQKDSPPLRKMAAHYEQISLRGFTHHRPPFLIAPIVDRSGKSVSIDESVATQTPFCDLVRFRKSNSEDLPKVLLVAPMSGHFATLLRGTVQTLVQDHEVYLTDWLNIRDIHFSCGEFDVDSFIEHIQGFLRFLGPRVHLIGVCQPTVVCLAATSVMAEDRDPCVPASLTLMAGPIDTRSSPTQVNELSMSKDIEWFENNLIGVVPFQFQGSGRRVYPGFIQLMAFMNMNVDRHRQSFRNLLEHRLNGDDERADLIRDFYQEYFAIMDLSAKFYLETVDRIFQRHLLPKGEFTFKDRLVNPKALRKTFLLTVEGERDDICGIGQTLAAHDLCSKLPGYMKSHHLQAGVGHYGVFNGKRWDAQIYPVVRAMIQSAK